MRSVHVMITTRAAAGAVCMTVFVLLLDHSLKLVVRSQLRHCEEPALSACDHIGIGSGLHLVSTTNAGSVLGVAQGLDLWMVLALVSLLLIPLYGSRLDWRRPLIPLAVGLQAGGALSNLLDRLFGGGVVDYLAILPATLVLNLGDIALVLGALFATWEVGRGRVGTSSEPHVLVVDRISSMRGS